MICRDTQELFSDFFDGALDGVRRAEIESHLASCASCRDDYRVFRQGITALHTTASIEAPERFVEAVTTTMRIEKLSVEPQPTPRRSTSAHRQPAVAPRTPSSWTPLAIAASVMASFALGFLLTRSASRDEIARLTEELKREREKPPPRVELPNNVVIVNGRQIAINEFIESEFAKADLVRDKGRWVSATMKAEFEKNARALNDKIAQLDRELAASKGAVPAVAETTEEKALEKLKLVKWDDWYVRPEWVESLEARKVLMDGEWKSIDDMIGAIMKDNRLVQHEGRWMTEEQLAGLVAQQFIRRPAAASLDSALAAALDGLEIAPPMTYKNLTLYPLLSAGGPAPAVTPLHEAIAAGRLKIQDTGSALSVRVKNDGATDVMFLGGTLLVGGKYARVVSRDTVVPAGKTADVRVFDAEPSGSVRLGDEFKPESGHYIVTGALRRAMASDAGQGYVWTSIAASLNGIKKATSPADLYKAHLAALVEYRMALIELRSAHPRAAGVAVAIADRLEYVEVFSSPLLFSAYFERILQAASLEAALRKDDAKGGALPHSMAAVKQFVESAFGAEAETVEESVVVRSGGRVAGRALVRDGAALHVSLYVESQAPEPRAALEISPAKVSAVLADYEARLKSAPAVRRPAVVREIAGLPQKRATLQLLAHLDDADVQVRRAVIEALGRRGDADAVKPLLQIFKRGDALVFAAATESLARLGHEDAVNPFLEVLQGKDAQAAGIVADRIATLLLLQRKESVLENAVGRMIDALEVATDKPPGGQLEAGYQHALAAALRATTGHNWSVAVDYRKWWNDPLNRKKFLEERQR